MSHFDILLPFGLPPPEMAEDIVRSLKAPALASLISRTRSHRRKEFDGFSRALPHEIWLASRFGLEHDTLKRGSPPVATAAMHAYGMPSDTGIWFVLHPVHLHVARDHLVLTNQQQLHLSDLESRALFDAVKSLFDEMDKPLRYGDAHTWFVRADAWIDLRTATPDAAYGHNIDIWLPQGPGDREWRKLQNDIQMHWHAHPVNQEREARGDKPVNSVWLWGGAPAPTPSPKVEYSELVNLSGWANALGRLSSTTMKSGTAADIIGATTNHGLVVLDNLIEPALAGDWSEWITRLHDLESDWFTPLSEALGAGKVDQISFTLTHGTELAEFISGRYSLRKFWIKPSLARLVQ
jgi:hypothetical protein